MSLVALLGSFQELHLCSSYPTVSKPSPFLEYGLGSIHDKKTNMAEEVRHYSKWQCRDMSTWNFGVMRNTGWVYLHLAKNKMLVNVKTSVKHVLSQ